MSYQAKVVVITGAGGGIGRILALTYAKQGAEVVIVDKNAQKLEETQSEIRASGGQAVSYLIDLVDAQQIEGLVKDIRKSLERIDVLINNAGLGVSKSPYNLEVDEWDYVINTNLRAAFLLSRGAAGIMREHGGGAIVNISSTRALMSEANSEAYAASKGGILSLTHAMAVSLGADRITVNAISPGWIETGDYDRLRMEDNEQHPAMRVGKPDDIARACLFLTNPENDFITGINLVVDGGMTHKMMYIE